MTYLMAEDPVALRLVAATFRREGELVSSELRSLATLSMNLNYQGPAADKMREAMNLAGQVGEEQAAALADAAARLESAALQAEAEMAARRAAGLV